MDWLLILAGWIIGSFFGVPVLGALIGLFAGRIFSVKSTATSAGGYTQRTSYDTYSHTSSNQASAFVRALMLLTAYVVRADGRVMHSEMEFVRTFLRNNFNAITAAQAEQILLQFIQEEKQNPSVFASRVKSGTQSLRFSLSQEQSYALFSILVDLSKADGNVDSSERVRLQEICGWLRLDSSILQQLLGLGGASLDDAYQVLGVSPDATDAEVKAAYRKLALQYHPDKVQALGEDVRKLAEKKFQEINAAKEKIWQQRGL